MCAFRWFIFVFIIENARSKKQNLPAPLYILDLELCPANLVV